MWWICLISPPPPLPQWLLLQILTHISHMWMCTVKETKTGEIRITEEERNRKSIRSCATQVNKGWRDVFWTILHIFQGTEWLSETFQKSWKSCVFIWESPSQHRCPDAARVQTSPPPSQDNGHLCTTLTPPPPDHFPSVCLPGTVHVLCSNCRAPFRPVEYMCCVFLSFALSASLRPLYLLSHNKPCSCFPSAWGRSGCCRLGETV